jgi:hypothetical protein
MAPDADPIDAIHYSAPGDPIGVLVPTIHTVIEEKEKKVSADQFLNDEDVAEIRRRTDLAPRRADIAALIADRQARIEESAPGMMKESNMGSAGCLVCMMPAPKIPLAVHYGPSESPPLQGVQLYLCGPHAKALEASSVRPVVPILLRDNE